jgi:hypothetical protein
LLLADPPQAIDLHKSALAVDFEKDILGVSSQQGMALALRSLLLEVWIGVMDKTDV